MNELDIKMLELLASKSDLASVVHGLIDTPTGNLNQLFSSDNFSGVLDFIRTGTSQSGPSAGRLLVMPGAPEESVFFQQLTQGVMAGIFSDEEVSLVREWIAAMEIQPGQRLDPDLTEQARSIRTVEDLQAVLQAALVLEHATLPPYLTAMYSLDTAKNPEIREIFAGVIRDEMVHMGLIANLLHAIGGTPKFSGPEYVPQFPGALPFNVASGLEVGLAPFSMDRVVNVFMRIETPAQPLDVPELLKAELELPEYGTIGELYEALVKAFEDPQNDYLTQAASIPQVTALGGRVHPITTREQAVAALRTIALEGEGDAQAPFSEGGEVAHYYRFEQIVRGKRLIEAPGQTPPYGYSSAPQHRIGFDPSGVHEFAQNTSPSDYPEGSDERTKLRKFSRTYVRMLDALERGFNGDAPAVGESIGIMVGPLTAQALALVRGGLGLPFGYPSQRTENRKRFTRVLEILDEAVGGPDVPVGLHGAFWRGVGHAKFVALKVFGLPLIALGDGEGSILVRSLKGTAPFGSDLGVPGATYPRMPVGFEAASAESIRFIEEWIDDGCPDDDDDDDNDDPPVPEPGVLGKGTLEGRGGHALTGKFKIERRGGSVHLVLSDDFQFDGAPEPWWAFGSERQEFDRETMFAPLGANEGGQEFVVPESIDVTSFAQLLLWCRPLDSLLGVGPIEIASGPTFPTDPYANHRWRPTNLTPASRRTDDVWFIDERTGWAVNSDGFIRKTEDGGDTWTEQHHAEGTFMRCVGFANADIGWVGTFNPEMRLLHTRNGGETWTEITNLPGAEPRFICGLYVVDENVVYAAGTNDQLHRATILKTTDGGDSWTSIDMDAHAASLIDVFFEDENRGWVVGGVDTVKHPNRQAERGDLVPGVFRTLDGGQTWTNKVAGPRYVRDRGGMFPQGEWCWKIQVIDETTIVVANQNYRDGAMLRSDDGGETWERLPLNDHQRNSNLEGIGFLDTQRGWIGGWGDYRYEGGYTSATMDGGKNWVNANQVGFRINRFRPIGTPPTVVYASGETVYKYSADPVDEEAMTRHRLDIASGTFAGQDEIDVPIEVPAGATRLTVRIWERDGRFIRLLLDETAPSQGARTLQWDCTDEAGTLVAPGCFIVRVTTNLSAYSVNVYRRPE